MSQLWIHNKIMLDAYDVLENYHIKISYDTTAGTINIKKQSIYTLYVEIFITFNTLEELNSCLTEFAYNDWVVFPYRFEFVSGKTYFDDGIDNKYVDFVGDKYILSAKFPEMYYDPNLNELVTIFIQHSSKMFSFGELIKIQNILVNYILVDNISNIICDFLVGGV